MEIWKETQLRKLAVESNVETAYRIALNFFNSMGYEYCAFSTTAHLAGQRFDSVNLNNYPHDWNTEYEKNHYSSIDPIVAHCHHSILPIVWDSKTFAKAPPSGTHWRSKACSMAGHSRRATPTARASAC